MTSSDPPLTDHSNAILLEEQTPCKSRISLEQTCSPATPRSPDTPHSNCYVTASSTPSTLLRRAQVARSDQDTHDNGTSNSSAKTSNGSDLDHASDAAPIEQFNVEQVAVSALQKAKQPVFTITDKTDMHSRQSTPAKHLQFKSFPSVVVSTPSDASTPASSSMQLTPFPIVNVSTPSVSTSVSESPSTSGYASSPTCASTPGSASTSGYASSPTHTCTSASASTPTSAPTPASVSGCTATAVSSTSTPESVSTPCDTSIATPVSASVTTIVAPMPVVESGAVSCSASTPASASSIAAVSQAPPPSTSSFRTPPPRNLVTSFDAWTKPTRPVSPKFKLAAAASLRQATAQKNIPQPVPKPVKVKAKWPAGETIPKSPSFMSRGKMLSAEAAHRRAEILAEQVMEKEEQEKKEMKIKARRDKWAKTRTMPKSPAFKRKVGLKTVEEKKETKFVARKMPEFGWVEVKGTLKSAAHAKVNKNGGVVKKKVIRREHQVIKPTVAKPFELNGVLKHQMAGERREIERNQMEEEVRRRRVFQPVELKEEILEGPTFVPDRSAVSLTKPVDLLPKAQERKERTEAFQRRQRERMAEMAKQEEDEQREKEEKELEQVRLEFKEKMFKPRAVPKSHYTPDIDPMGSSTDGSKLGDGEKLMSVSGIVDVVEGNTDKKDSNEKVRVVKRTSFFDGIRKSLSPLLGSPESVNEGNE